MSAFRDLRSSKRLGAPELERDCVLSGGDDYELAFTAPRAQRAEIESLAAELGLALTRIGTIEAGSGLSILDAKRQADRPPRRLRPLQGEGGDRVAPAPGFAFSHPAHAIAFGFGAGLSPFAPGTAGTALGWAIGWALGALHPAMFFSVVVGLFPRSACGPAR